MNAPLKHTAEAATTFVRRHIGPSPRDVSAMLETVGAKTLGALMGETLPSSIRQKAPLDLGTALSETEALAHMRELASQNQVFTSLIGQGYSGTILPAVIQRNILENPAWYTAYTPYQPEISQGRLEALFNFQTMICDLSGLDVANASLLDEATAAAEAMALAERAAQAKTKSFFVDSEVHPQTLAVLRTRAEPLGWNLIVGDPLADLGHAEVFGALLQYPGTSGAVRDLRPAIATLHAKGALAIVAADLLALTLLASPGELGADIAVGSAQRFGVPMGYGGPHAAYMAVRDALKRSLPGRIVGLSIDSRGEPAYRLALQTREQHIRREKATSNICTAQVLLAVIASMYAVYHGPEGLTHIARTVHRRASVLAAGLRKLGFAPQSEAFFDTVTVDGGARQSEIVARALAEKINLRIGARTLGIALDEATTPDRRRGGMARIRRQAGLRGSRIRRTRCAASRIETVNRVPHPSGVPRPSLRDRTVALHAQALGPRSRARPRDDSAGLLHHEAQCHVGDDPADLAGIRLAASVRAARAGGRLSRAVQAA